MQTLESTIANSIANENNKESQPGTICKCLNVCLLFVQIPDVTNKYKIEVLLFLHAVDQKII